MSETFARKWEYMLTAIFYIILYKHYICNSYNSIMLYVFMLYNLKHYIRVHKRAYVFVYFKRGTIVFVWAVLSHSFSAGLSILDLSTVYLTSYHLCIFAYEIWSKCLYNFCLCKELCQYLSIFVRGPLRQSPTDVTQLYQLLNTCRMHLLVWH